MTQPRSHELTVQEAQILLVMAERGWEERGLPPHDHPTAERALEKLRAIIERAD